MTNLYKKTTSTLLLTTIIALTLFVTLSYQQVFATGTLYAATDTEEFAGISPPDNLAKMETAGPAVNSNLIIVTDYPVNGLGDGGTFLFAGNPLDNTISRIDFDGVFLSSFVGGNPPIGGCCMEDMAFDPVTSLANPNGILYHPDWPENIQAVDPVTGALLALYDMDQVVGMAHVGDEIWISKWTPREVGPWDPATNTFTPVFNTPTNAGCLAWDEVEQVLWVGLQGGAIHPYALDGTSLGPDYLPFGPISDTIDGCVFLGESSSADVTKSWTFTDYNWDPICTLFDSITGECLETRPANISEPTDDVLADPLPQDADDKYLLNAVVNKNKVQNTNPGAFYALTTVVINTDLDKLTVWEDYADCYNDQGLIQFVSKPDSRNVKVAVADSNGDVTELSDGIYDGTVGAITSIDTSSAHVEITDPTYLTAGSTVYVLVKFQDDLKGDAAPDNIFDAMCMNTETVHTEIDSVDAGSFEANAALRITTSP